MSNYGALSGIFSGLTNTYSVLASQYKDKDGVTLENVYVESSKGNNILNVKNAKNLTVDGKVYEELGAKEEILSLK